MMRTVCAVMLMVVIAMAPAVNGAELEWAMLMTGTTLVANASETRFGDPPPPVTLERAVGDELEVSLWIWKAGTEAYEWIEWYIRSEPRTALRMVRVDDMGLGGGRITVLENPDPVRRVVVKYRPPAGSMPQGKVARIVYRCEEPGEIGLAMDTVKQMMASGSEKRPAGASDDKVVVVHAPLFWVLKMEEDGQ